MATDAVALSVALDLIARGWRFSVREDRLLYDAPADGDFDTDLALVRANRDAIIAAVEANLIPVAPNPLPSGREGTIPVVHRAPLDEMVAHWFAHTRSAHEVEARIRRLEQRVAHPDATPLDVIVLDDWRRIRAAQQENA